jgi:hypothetical protein
VSRLELIWNGTPEECLELLAAVQRNCTCNTDVKGARGSVCEAHTMLIQHQRVLNGLLFARRIAQRFIREEWLLGDPAGSGLKAEQVIQQLSAPNPVGLSGTRRTPRIDCKIRQRKR